MTQRGYGKDAIMEMGFSTKEYEFPETEGKFVGTLVMKKWNNKGGLICYFDTDDGRKLKLCVWFSYKEERSYASSLDSFGSQPHDTLMRRRTRAALCRQLGRW